MVNIVVVSFNRRENTRECIRRIREKTRSDYLLTVVDNGSADGSAEDLLSIRDAIDHLILLNRNYGVAPAANTGWAIADTEYYCKMDNDIYITRPDWLSTMVEITEIYRSPRFGVLSQNLYARDANHPWHEVQTFPGARLAAPANGIEVYGGCVLIRREVWETVGFWREDFGQYGWEDTDYGIRLMLAGYNNYFPLDCDYMTHEGENDAQEYLQFKTGKHEALSRTMGARVLYYMLNLQPLRMVRRYRTIFREDGIHASLHPVSENSATEEQQFRRFVRFLETHGWMMAFPRTREESMRMGEVFRAIRDRYQSELEHILRDEPVR